MKRSLVESTELMLPTEAVVSGEQSMDS